MTWTLRHKSRGSLVDRSKPRVLVLGGGPDAEREVSLISSRAIADALVESKRFAVERIEIDRLSIDDLSSLPGDVVFPALHGGWGEGGPLQDLLEADGRPFVGSFARTARAAMDKVATKIAAASIGIPTPECFVLDRRDSSCPIPFPVAMKPIHEGSTIGLHICRSPDEWARAREHLDSEPTGGDPFGVRSYMIEPLVAGGRARELTIGMLDGEALPVIEIRPADGLYDYEAKYTREDTRYLIEPPLPDGVRERIQDQTVRLARRLGVRHVARADFLLDENSVAWFLEINTMPGFTGHSLVPMAASHIGIGMPQLCERLVRLALRDHVPAAPTA
ncbi:MAG: D-alanine--D-alanine ligase [Phycisphaeraceae bacterium]|nr:D-alanine--D-alanine ligase [Phycisphaeraceae bacterium]